MTETPSVSSPMSSPLLSVSSSSLLSSSSSSDSFLSTLLPSSDSVGEIKTSTTLNSRTTSVTSSLFSLSSSNHLTSPLSSSSSLSQSSSTSISFYPSPSTLLPRSTVTTTLFKTHSPTQSSSDGILNYSKTPSTVKTGGSEHHTDSSNNCVTIDPRITYFGHYGIIGTSIGGGIAFICLFILFVVLCWPKWVARRKRIKKKKEQVNGGNSELREISGLYRPRPSLKKSTQCVPTPLAMVSDELSSASNTYRSYNQDINNGDSEDSDEQKKLDTIQDFVEVSLDAVDEKQINGTDRKQSQIDPANVSTFLLRQTSLKLQEERKMTSPV